MAARERPLSPHMQVYRFGYTMLLSFSHRLAGMALSFGFLLLSCWLLAIAGGEAEYAAVMAFMGTWPVKVALAVWLLAFWYHLFNGLRHLAWDAGYGFEKAQARRTGVLVVVLTVLGFIGGLLYWHFTGGGA